MHSLNIVNKIIRPLLTIHVRAGPSQTPSTDLSAPDEDPRHGAVLAVAGCHSEVGERRHRLSPAQPQRAGVDVHGEQRRVLARDRVTVGRGEGLGKAADTSGKEKPKMHCLCLIANNATSPKIKRVK